MSSEAISTSDKNFFATSNSASSGQGWNQSITVQLIIAGNLVALYLKRSPTGEKQRDICKFLFTLSMKNFQQLSFESKIPSPLTAGLIAFTIESTSSKGNKSGISPEDNRSLIKTKNLSFVI